MTDSLTFTFVPDPAEQVRANQAVTRRQRYSWLRPWGWTVVIFMPAVLAFALDVPITALWPYGVIIIALAAYFALHPALLRRQIRRAMAQTPLLREPQTYRFTDDAVQMSNPLASAELRWGAIIEAAETPEFLLLYYSPKCAYYLPKRILGARLDEVRQFVRERLGSRASGVASSEVGTRSHN